MWASLPTAVQVLVIVVGVYLVLGIVAAVVSPSSTKQVATGTSAAGSTAAPTTQPPSSTTTSIATSTTTPASTTTTTTAPTTTTTAPPPTTPPPAADLYYSGIGDQVLSLGQTIREARIATITHQGSSNFVVKALSPVGSDELLVNEIGSYTGTVPIAFADGDQVDGFEINASGPWTITIKDLAKAPELANAAGTRFDGTGDNVVRFTTGSRQPLKVSCPGCQGNFVVTAYGRTRDLLVNEIGAYDGSVLVPGSNVVLEVHAGAGFRGPAPSWFLVVP